MTTDKRIEAVALTLEVAWEEALRQVPPGCEYRVLVAEPPREVQSGDRTPARVEIVLQPKA